MPLHLRTNCSQGSRSSSSSSSSGTSAARTGGPTHIGLNVQSTSISGTGHRLEADASPSGPWAGNYYTSNCGNATGLDGFSGMMSSQEDTMSMHGSLRSSAAPMTGPAAPMLGFTSPYQGLVVPKHELAGPLHGTAVDDQSWRASDVDIAQPLSAMTLGIANAPTTPGFSTVPRTVSTPLSSHLSRLMPKVVSHILWRRRAL